MTLQDLNKLSIDLINTAPMPVLFLGHGSPMNAIESNYYTQEWLKIRQDIPTPTAILCISAHWLTKGTSVTAMENPRTIHDFGGFPDELFAVQYPAPGTPEFAAFTAKEITQTEVGLDYDWGLDHGTWSLLNVMFPEAQIPVFQLSIDYYKPAQYHYDLAQQLKKLRSKGVLIIGSGNIVHNLRMVKMADEGFDWAAEFDSTIKTLIDKREDKGIIDYHQLGASARLAVPTPDHYYPLLYALGASDFNSSITHYTEKTTMGSISMRSIKFS